MPRLSNSKLRKKHNKGSHRRPRYNGRGGRMMKKFEEHKWHETLNGKKEDK